jgi:hypothetical protein
MSIETSTKYTNYISMYGNTMTRGELIAACDLFMPDILAVTHDGTPNDDEYSYTLLFEDRSAVTHECCNNNITLYVTSSDVIEHILLPIVVDMFSGNEQLMKLISSGKHKKAKKMVIETAENEKLLMKLVRELHDRALEGKGFV